MHDLHELGIEQHATEAGVLALNERVAFHEAGHAVAAFHHGLKVRRVSIKPDAEAQGYCLLAPSRRHFDMPLSLRVRHAFESHFVVAFAGPLSELRHRDGSPDDLWEIGRTDDHAELEESVLEIIGNQPEADAYLQWLRVRTEQFLADIDVWQQVEVVAFTLLKWREIDGGPLKEAMQQAMGANFVARRRWG